MEGTAKPDYATCVKISTDASIKEMIPPGALVMLTPLIVGTLFGVETLSGVLAGALVSGVQVRALPYSTLFVHFQCVYLFWDLWISAFDRLPSLHPTPVVHGTMPRSTLR
jgi:inorganic pyrophosphatase